MRNLLIFLALSTMIGTQSGLCWAEDIESLSSPSKDVTLSFFRPGRIAEVLVADGDEVAEGQVLVRLDDEAEQVQLAQQKVRADDNTKIDASEAQLAQSQVDLDRKEKARKKEHSAVTEMEIEHARLEVRINKAKLAIAKFDQGQEQYQYDQLEIQLKRMHLRSPFAGVAKEIFLHPGEAADQQAAIIQVVKIDPLWINVPVPLRRAMELKVGNIAKVKFVAESDLHTNGKIIYIDPVADSGTLMVRVEVPNKSRRPAGEKVMVNFQSP